MRFKQVHRFSKKRRTPEKRLPGTAIAVENGNVDKAIRKLKRNYKKKICSMNFVKENITKQGTKEKEKRRLQVQEDV